MDSDQDVSIKLVTPQPMAYVPNGAACLVRTPDCEVGYAYRARAISTIDDTLSAKPVSVSVYMVDLGLYERIPIGDVYQIPEEYLKEPPKAIQCEIHNIASIQPYALEVLQEKFENGRCMVMFRAFDYNSEIYTIEMYRQAAQGYDPSENFAVYLLRQKAARWIGDPSENPELLLRGSSTDRRRGVYSPHSQNSFGLVHHQVGGPVRNNNNTAIRHHHHNNAVRESSIKPISSDQSILRCTQPPAVSNNNNNMPPFFQPPFPPAAAFYASGPGMMPGYPNNGMSPYQGGPYQPPPPNVPYGNMYRPAPPMAAQLNNNRSSTYQPRGGAQSTPTPQYPISPNFSTPSTIVLRVKVTFIVSPKEFYVREDAKQPLFIKLCNDLREYMRSYPPRADVRFVGVNQMFVFADGEEVRRVKVLTLPANRDVKVQFIDEGVIRRVPLEKLFVISEELAKVALLTFPCMLHTNDGRTEWTEEQCDLFSKLIKQFKSVRLDQYHFDSNLKRVFVKVMDENEVDLGERLLSEIPASASELRPYHKKTSSSVQEEHPLKQPECSVANTLIIPNSGSRWYKPEESSDEGSTNAVDKVGVAAQEKMNDLDRESNNVIGKDEQEDEVEGVTQSMNILSISSGATIVCGDDLEAGIAQAEDNVGCQDAPSVSVSSSSDYVRVTASSQTPVSISSDHPSSPPVPLPSLAVAVAQSDDVMPTSAVAATNRLRKRIAESTTSDEVYGTDDDEVRATMQQSNNNDDDVYSNVDNKLLAMPLPLAKPTTSATSFKSASSRLVGDRNSENDDVVINVKSTIIKDNDDDVMEKEKVVVCDDAMRALNDEREALKTWDPMKEDYKRALNVNDMFADDDDADDFIRDDRNAAVVRQRPCKFYLQGHCTHGDACTEVHMQPLGVDVDGGGERRIVAPQRGLVVVGPPESLKLPRPGDNVYVHVTFVMSPVSFYVVFPYGPKRLEDLSAEEDEASPSLDLLAARMNEYYGSKPRVHRVEYSSGCFVAAYVSGTWSRATILEQYDDYVVVSCADYGTEAEVPVSDIRELRAEFLQYMPFQAVLAMLSNVSPPDGEGWDCKSVEYFISEVETRLLVAQVVDVLSDDKLQLDIFVGELDESGDPKFQSLRTMMIDAGLASPS